MFSYATPQHRAGYNRPKTIPTNQIMLPFSHRGTGTLQILIVSLPIQTEPTRLRHYESIWQQWCLQCSPWNKSSPEGQLRLLGFILRQRIRSTCCVYVSSLRPHPSSFFFFFPLQMRRCRNLATSLIIWGKNENGRTGNISIDGALGQILG